MGSCFDQKTKRCANSVLGQRKSIDALSRSADKPRLEYCEDQYGTIICSRPVQGHNYGAQINPTLISIERYTDELLRTHVPLVQFF